MEISLLTEAYLNRTVALQVYKSAAGFYLGALSEHGEPLARDSEEYWGTRGEAEAALANGNWTQRQSP